jgi:hypothetical protein
VQTDVARLSDFRDLGEASHRRAAPLAREREIPERCSGAQKWLRAVGSGRSSKAWFQGLVPTQRRCCSPGCRDLDVVVSCLFQAGDCDVERSDRGWPLREAADGGTASQSSEFQANNVRSSGWSRVRHPPA